LLDGFVLARSAFHHSANYRSIMLFGKSEEVLGASKKEAILRAFLDRFFPGRWAEVRRPSGAEVAGTRIMGIPIEVGSAKVRDGPPIDNAADLDRKVWAGVVPTKLTTSPVVPDCHPDVPAPAYLRQLKIG
jgi:hypothetical protein